MRMHRPPLLFALLAAAAACTSTPAWNQDESRRFVAMQAAVDERLRAGEAALATDASVALPDGADLDHVDEHLDPVPQPEGEGATVATAGSAARCRLPGWIVRSPAGTKVAFAGHVLDGFDRLDDVAVQPERGIVLLGTRRGTQTITTGAGVWSGQLWRTDLAPKLSTDGSCFVYVEEGIWADRSMLAPTADPTQGRPIPLDGRIHWPIWPGRDGRRIRAIVEVDGRIEIRDNGQVVASAESYAHPFYDEDLDQVRVHLITGGKTRVLVGDQLLPPLDSYRLVLVSADGRTCAAVGREGDTDWLVVGGARKFSSAHIVAAALSADGSTWACAFQVDGLCRVVSPEGIGEAMPLVQDLVFAADGSALAVRTQRDGRPVWTVQGEELGGYDDVQHLQLLPARGGAVFAGRDGAGWWVVAGARRDGPWDEVGSCRLLEDGAVVAIARRGQQAHRRVIRTR